MKSKIQIKLYFKEKINQTIVTGKNHSKKTGFFK